MEGIQDPFETMGTDIEIGVKLFQSLKLGPAEFKDAQKLGRLKDITAFLNKCPDASFIIDVITRSNKNPERSNLDHFWSYVELKKQENEAKNSLGKLKKELDFYEN